MDATPPVGRPAFEKGLIMKTKAWPAALAVSAGIVIAVAVGLGGGDERATSRSGTKADAAFIADMTAHHEGAIEMARIAQGRAEHPEIRQLADDIVAAQEDEIAAMQHIGVHVRGHAAGADGHMGMSDAEMGMDMEPAMLDDAEPFDRAFIDMMIPHHQGAVGMAKQLLQNGEHRNLRAMAQDIIDAQTKEIAQMRTWRRAWYGAAVSSAGPMADHGH